MNDNILYTRCPTCNTAFKVTDKLLGLAGGKVRCGACLAVFQASDYMLRPSAETSAEVEVEVEPKPKAEPKSEFVREADESSIEASAPSQSDSEDKSIYSTQDAVAEEIIQEESQIDLNLDVISTDEAITVPADNFPEPETLETSSSFDELNDDSHNSNFEESLLTMDEVETDQETNDRDDSFAGFNYADESADYDEEPNDFDRDLIDTSENLDVLSETEKEAEQEHQEPDEDIATGIDFDGNDDSNSDLEQDGEISDSEEQDCDRESSNEFTETTEEEFEHEIDDDLVDIFDEDFTEGQEEVTEDDYDELSEQLHDQMEETDTDPDPLDEFDEIAKDEKTGVKTQIIFAAIAVLLSIAIYQFWSNRQALAWSDSWGSSVKAVCNFLPCNLKPRRDVGSIKLLQRQLSPDEEKENYLDIKILLINEADFDQPYPTINIRFSDKNGDQVSLKSFPPTEYLEGDAETLLMPSGSEVHIHFKTEEDHPDALGFEFIFE